MTVFYIKFMRLFFPFLQHYFYRSQQPLNVLGSRERRKACADGTDFCCSQFLMGKGGTMVATSQSNSLSIQLFHCSKAVHPLQVKANHRHIMAVIRPLGIEDHSFYLAQAIIEHTG